jgi:ketosteroid isomerase-like protein
MEMTTEKEILELEDKRLAAQVAEDFATLEALLHDELIYTHSSGVVDTKASWIESMRSRKTRYRKITPSRRKVRFYGDTALLTGHADIEAEIDAQPKSLKLMYLIAWTRTPKGWKFVAWQSAPRPA